MDLTTLINTMSGDGYFTRIARDERAQFGTPARPYLGATVLPERRVEQNAYREDAIRFRTTLANDGSRYSPAQKKTTCQLVGSMLVELGNQDIASEFTGQDYDNLMRFLQSNASMEAIAQVINWVEVVINRSLLELLEKQRWQAIVSAQVTRTGDNGFSETVTYPNPSGQRRVAGGTWSSNSYDPFDDISEMVDHFYDLGYDVNRIITSRRVTSILARNALFAQRVANVRVLSGSDLVGRANQGQINSYLQAEGIPAIETYDARWRSETSIGRFIPDDVMIFLSTTGQDTTIDWGDSTRFVPDTLGYTAIGRPVGLPDPGRVIRMWAKDDKPPRLQAEGWQTTLPVLTEPEALAVISAIA